MFAPPLRPRRLLALAPAALVALGACGDSTGPAAPGRVALSFAARGSASGSSGVAGANGGTIVVSGSDTLAITSVRFVIDEVELLRGTSGTCVGDDDDTIEVNADCAELETGPYLVNLPMNGALTSALAVELPPGSYRKLEMKLRQADSGDDRAFRAAHPEMNGITVRVAGTYRGQPFTWQGDVEADLEMYFSPAMVVEGAGNFTVNIDVGRWFRSASGAIIDPATAGADQANFSTVAQNVRASFGVFEDDDRDGRDDHGGDRDD